MVQVHAVDHAVGMLVAGAKRRTADGDARKLGKSFDVRPACEQIVGKSPWAQEAAPSRAAQATRMSSGM